MSAGKSFRTIQTLVGRRPVAKDGFRFRVVSDHHVAISTTFLRVPQQTAVVTERFTAVFATVRGDQQTTTVDVRVQMIVERDFCVEPSAAHVT